MQSTLSRSEKKRQYLNFRYGGVECKRGITVKKRNQERKIGRKWEENKDKRTNHQKIQHLEMTIYCSTFQISSYMLWSILFVLFLLNSLFERV